MLHRFKKIVSIIIIIVLLPYIITLFINGGQIEKKTKVDEKSEHLEDYCISILAKEVSSDYEEEMLKVQAILVRTTVYKEIEEKGEITFEDYNNSNLEAAWYKKLKKIWKETEGQVITYDGELALVPFHQVSNGKTRNGKEMLGKEDYPYLRIIECPQDVEASNQIESKFIETTGVVITEVDSAGYVLAVKVGEENVTGENFRSVYSLASSCFEIQEFENKTRIITKGVGHGLGLSQYTANEMAKEGKTYKEILQYFFEGTEIKEVAEILWNVE